MKSIFYLILMSVGAFPTLTQAASTIGGSSTLSSTTSAPESCVWSLSYPKAGFNATLDACKVDPNTKETFEQMITRLRLKIPKPIRVIGRGIGLCFDAIQTLAVPVSFYLTVQELEAEYDSCMVNAGNELHTCMQLNPRPGETRAQATTRCYAQLKESQDACSSDFYWSITDEFFNDVLSALPAPAEIPGRISSWVCEKLFY